MKTSRYFVSQKSTCHGYEASSFPMRPPRSTFVGTSTGVAATGEGPQQPNSGTSAPRTNSLTRPTLSDLGAHHFDTGGCANGVPAQRQSLRPTLKALGKRKATDEAVDNHEKCAASWLQGGGRKGASPLRHERDPNLDASIALAVALQAEEDALARHERCDRQAWCDEHRNTFGQSIDASMTRCDDGICLGCGSEATPGHNDRNELANRNGAYDPHDLYDLDDLYELADLDGLHYDDYNHCDIQPTDESSEAAAAAAAAFEMNEPRHIEMVMEIRPPSHGVNADLVCAEVHQQTCRGDADEAACLEAPPNSSRRRALFGRDGGAGVAATAVAAAAAPRHDSLWVD